PAPTPASPYAPTNSSRLSSVVAGAGHVPHVARLQQRLQRGRPFRFRGFLLLLPGELIDRRQVHRPEHAHYLWIWRLERRQRHRQRHAVAALVVDDRALGRALFQSKAAADAQPLVARLAVDERLAVLELEEPLVAHVLFASLLQPAGV